VGEEVLTQADHERPRMEPQLTDQQVADQGQDNAQAGKQHDHALAALAENPEHHQQQRHAEYHPLREENRQCTHRHGRPGTGVDGQEQAVIEFFHSGLTLNVTRTTPRTWQGRYSERSWPPGTAMPGTAPGTGR